MTNASTWFFLILPPCLLRAKEIEYFFVECDAAANSGKRGAGRKSGRNETMIIPSPFESRNENGPLWRVNEKMMNWSFRQEGIASPRQALLEKSHLAISNGARCNAWEKFKVDLKGGQSLLDCLPYQIRRIKNSKCYNIYTHHIHTSLYMQYMVK